VIPPRLLLAEIKKTGKYNEYIGYRIEGRFSVVFSKKKKISQSLKSVVMTLQIVRRDLINGLFPSYVKELTIRST